MTTLHEPVLVLEGVNSILYLYEDRLVAHFKGLASGILPLIPLKDRVIPLDSIEDVKFYANRFLINGLIKVVVEDSDNLWFVYSGRRYTEAKAFVSRLRDFKARRAMSPPSDKALAQG